uniref:F-box protein 40 n=1 Tax=Poecilia reticulata TaxID=8081 RepID=A0A3P9N9L7_POERE
ENLLRERERFGCLDLAMALQDQDALFHSIKMKKLFPELIQTAEEERAAAKEARDKIWEAVNMVNVNFPDEKQDVDEKEFEENQPVLSQAEREAVARASEVDAGLLENYNAWERMFSMEMGGKGRGKSLGSMKEEEEATCAGAAASTSSACSSSLTGKPKKKSFVYGKLEPMKIITVRTFKIPTSFTARQRRICNPGFYKRENQAVDTSNLGVAPGDMPVWEEVQASLLCSLERERRGHLLAESTSSDSLRMDEGTNTSLADLTAGKPLELHLQLHLQVESVTSRHNKASSAFTVLCGHTFQRTEYGKHFKNILSYIQLCVNGCFEQRCPLAYMGCTYSQRRFRPPTYEATLSFLRPDFNMQIHQTDSLSSLPYEVLCHMASFLDSQSLSQLALVSSLMRQVCSSLLQDRGMVTLRWEKTSSSHGRAKWRVTHRVWQFSSLFSPVDAWSFRDVPSISEHLKVCPYSEVESKTEKIRLPRVQEEIKPKKSCEGPMLVTMFQEKRIMM